MLTLKTIDAHAAGEPLRLIVDGFPSPRGATMLEKREWVRQHADHLRRALMLEPRGHADMSGGDGVTVTYDSPAGTVRARARWAGEAGQAGQAGRVESVAFANVPSFVL